MAPYLRRIVRSGFIKLCLLNVAAKSQASPRAAIWSGNDDAQQAHNAKFPGAG